MKGKLVLMFMVLVIGSLLLVGCATSTDTDEDATADTPVIKIGYVQWA